MMKKQSLTILLAACFLLAACSARIDSSQDKKNQIQESIEKPKEAQVQEISVLAVGDIMAHMSQIIEARSETGYDFRPPFAEVMPAISQADIAIANFETTINGSREISGYPRFNSPPEILEGIRDTGFDMLVTANNHCMDTGIEGAENTIKLIKQNNMTPIGTGKENRSAILDVKGIKLGVLAYTVSTNGLEAPEGFVCIAEEKQIEKDLAGIRGQCDFIIVYLHAGVEYNRDVEEETEKLFKAVADMGADCVLGSHPHVARRSELYRTGGKDVLINYSMGNFVTNQDFIYTDIGTMTKLTIKKQGDIATLKDFEIIPTYRVKFVEAGKTKRRIILASEIDNCEYINDTQKKYITQVGAELTKLLDQDTAVGQEHEGN